MADADGCHRSRQGRCRHAAQGVWTVDREQRDAWLRRAGDGGVRDRLLLPGHGTGGLSGTAAGRRGPGHHLRRTAGDVRAADRPLARGLHRHARPLHVLLPAPGVDHREHSPDPADVAAAALTPVSRGLANLAIKADRWIKRMALEHGMIEPFEERQVRAGVVSYGLSSYGYDIRVADEFKVFTNVNNA